MKLFKKIKIFKDMIELEKLLNKAKCENVCESDLSRMDRIERRLRLELNMLEIQESIRKLDAMCRELDKEMKG